jgi:hypothetical protein
MATIQPGITGRRATQNVPERLLVRPRTAWRMLGCGNTRGYELINSGELVSFLDGRSRKVTVESIHQYIARKVAAANTIGAANEASAPSRRRGRPRKYPAHEIPT